MPSYGLNRIYVDWQKQNIRSLTFAGIVLILGWKEFFNLSIYPPDSQEHVGGVKLRATVKRLLRSAFEDAGLLLSD